MDVDGRARSAPSPEPVSSCGTCRSAATGAFGSGMHSALDAVVGGWELAGTYRYESGQYLRFRTA